MLPIPVTSSARHVEENVAAAGLILDREEFASIGEAAGFRRGYLRGPGSYGRAQGADGYAPDGTELSITGNLGSRR
jgi:hypothetical protein